MPCHRCGARQTDPARGASPWQRGVRRGQQVLVCPHCQLSAADGEELDGCPSCGSTRLVRALGSTRCRACGAAVVEPSEPTAPAAAAPGLAEDVAAALDRVLRRRPD